MRVALQNPPYCTACYGGKPQTRHIDFEAAYDGPVINNEDNIKVAIDDLIICEDCLVAAASMLGMVNSEEMKAENRELGETVEEYAAGISQRDEVIRDQKSTIDNLMDEKIQKKLGRPRRAVAA